MKPSRLHEHRIPYAKRTPLEPRGQLLINPSEKLQRDLRSFPFSAETLMEPLNLLAPGTILTPLPGETITVHVDSVRHQWNRHHKVVPPDPIIRIIVGPVTAESSPIYAAHGVRWTAPTTLLETYTLPLPRRTQAICVLQVAGSVEIVDPAQE